MGSSSPNSWGEHQTSNLQTITLRKNIHIPGIPFFLIKSRWSKQLRSIAPVQKHSQRQGAATGKMISMEEFKTKIWEFANVFFSGRMVFHMVWWLNQPS